MKKLVLILLLLFSFVSCKQEEKGYIFEVLYGGGYKENLKDFDTIKLVTESIDLRFTLARLELESIDAFVTNNYTAKHLLKNNDDLEVTGKNLQKNSIGIGLAKNNKELYRAVDREVKNILADGTLKEINKNYLLNLSNKEFDTQKRVKGNSDLSVDKLIVAFPNAYPPFSYMEEGELKGFDVEVAKEIANRLNLEFQGVLTDRIGMENRLLEGRYHMIMGNIAIGTRDELFYSNPYYESVGMIVTRRGSKLEL